VSRSRSRRRRRGARPLRGWRAQLVAIAGLTAIATLVAAGALWFWAQRAGPIGEPLHLDLPSGAQIEDVAEELHAQGALREPSLFLFYARLTRSPSTLPGGAHLLRRGLSPAALLARLTRSPARPTVKVTIPEGYNQFQIADRLEARDVARRDAFLASSADATLLGSLGIHAASAEGYLFPATYDLYVNSDAKNVVQTLVGEGLRRFRLLEQRHSKQLGERQAALGWGLHELVTLASIVEKEAADSKEHGMIASVFYNRLRDPSFLPKQMLQSDPTAGYGCLVATTAMISSCRDYDGMVTPLMLRDGANPYNTYKRPGLPPGPISNPSESAVEAVLNPPDTPFFFFVAGRSKRHVFSRTLSEHERAIATGSRGNE
jgi:UPF0755 protein